MLWVYFGRFSVLKPSPHSVQDNRNSHVRPRNISRFNVAVRSRLIKRVGTRYILQTRSSSKNLVVGHDLPTTTTTAKTDSKPHSTGLRQNWTRIPVLRIFLYNMHNICHKCRYMKYEIKYYINIMIKSSLSLSSRLL